MIHEQHGDRFEKSTSGLPKLIEHLPGNPDIGTIILVRQMHGGRFLTDQEIESAPSDQREKFRQYTANQREAFEPLWPKIDASQASIYVYLSSVKPSCLFLEDGPETPILARAPNRDELLREWLRHGVYDKTRDPLSEIRRDFGSETENVPMGVVQAALRFWGAGSLYAALTPSVTILPCGDAAPLNEAAKLMAAVTLADESVPLDTLQRALRKLEDLQRTRDGMLVASIRRHRFDVVPGSTATVIRGIDHELNKTVPGLEDCRSRPHILEYTPVRSAEDHGV